MFWLAIGLSALVVGGCLILVWPRREDPLPNPTRESTRYGIPCGIHSDPTATRKY